MITRMFPVLLRHGQRAWVPWDLVAPHETQAMKNHGQTLERMSERGGLSPDELAAVLRDRRWEQMDDHDAWRTIWEQRDDPA